MGLHAKRRKNMPWGGVVSFAVLNITGYQVFDWFFTLMLIFGLVGFMIGSVFKVITRS